MAYNKPHRSKLMNIELHKIGQHQCPECSERTPQCFWEGVFGYRRTKDVISWCRKCRKAQRDSR